MSARVESEADPRHPGRSGYRITGTDRAAVQLAIADIVNDVEDRGGMARFVGPVSVETDDGWAWGALGEVLIEQVPA